MASQDECPHGGLRGVCTDCTRDERDALLDAAKAAHDAFSALTDEQAKALLGTEQGRALVMLADAIAKASGRVT